MADHAPDTPDWPNGPDRTAPPVPQPSPVPYEPAPPVETPQNDPLPGADEKGD